MSIVATMAMTFSAIGVVIGLAMFFLVLWQAPRRRDNQLMAFYMITVIVWGSGVFTGQLSGLLGQTELLLGVIYSIALARSFNALLLFALVTHYVGLWQNRWVRGVLLASLGYRFFIVIPLLLQGQLYNQFVILPNGQVNFHIEPLGYALILANNAYYLATLGILWVYRREQTKYLLVGTIMLLIGVLITLTPLREYSLIITFMAISGVFFTYAIFQENVFSPLVKLNQELQEEEKKFRTLAETTTAGIFIHQGEKFLYANPTAETLMGYTLTELQTMHFWEIVHPESQPVVRERAQARLSGRQPPARYELKFVTKTGQTGWAYLTTGLIEYAGKQAILATAFDLTERKQVEAALTKTNEALQQRVNELAALNQITQTLATVIDLQSALEILAKDITTLFDAFSTGISLFNEGHTERRIVVMYQVQDQDKLDLVGRVTPLTNDTTYIEYISKGNPLVIPDPQTSSFTKHSRQSIRERNLQCLMLIPLRARGEIIGTISISTNQVGREFTPDEVKLAETVSGQIAGAIENARLYSAAQQEIAERKQAQEALAQARDQALEASRLKSQLLAKVSHELRTPLGAILGYVELLQEGIFGPLSEQQQAITAEIIDSTQYLSKLVSELLDQAQFETGRVSLQINPFTLKAVVDQIEAQMKPLAQAKGLCLTTEIAADLPLRLSGDSYRLKQILINLIGNAIKFTTSGKIGIYFYRPDPGHWAIQVSDTGAGIPEEARDYIFEPFRQVDGSITREQSGTGLGLSIVKQLTTLMEGEVHLKSQIGRGSTFTVLLPLFPIEEEEETP